MSGVRLSASGVGKFPLDRVEMLSGYVSSAIQSISMMSEIREDTESESGVTETGRFDAGRMNLFDLIMVMLAVLVLAGTSVGLTVLLYPFVGADAIVYGGLAGFCLFFTVLLVTAGSMRGYLGSV